MADRRVQEIDAALSEDLPDVQERTRLRFAANDALKLYEVVPSPAGKAVK